VGSSPGQTQRCRLEPDSSIRTIFRNARRAAWTRAIGSGGTPYEVEFRLCRGRWARFRWFLGRAGLAGGATRQGEIIAWIGTNTDVHDQKLIAGETRRIERRPLAPAARRGKRPGEAPTGSGTCPQDLVCWSPIATAIWRTVNPAWTRTLGWRRGRIAQPQLGSGWKHPDDGGCHRAAQMRKLGEKRIHRQVREAAFRHRDGSYRWLSWTAVPDQDHIYAVGPATSRAEKGLRAERAESHRRKALPAVAEDGSGWAIDRRGSRTIFNNLLTGIVGSLRT